MNVSYAWAPITKSEKQADGTVIVYGPAASSALDNDKQRLDADWLDSAMPRWMAEGGGVREQHDPKRAVGVGVGLSKGEDGAHWLTAHIIDPVAVKKIEHKVLRGFSVGIKSPRIEMGKADAPNGLVTGGDVIEVSVVDRPANSGCLFTLAKADSAGDLALIDDPQVIESTEPAGSAEPVEAVVEQAADHQFPTDPAAAVPVTPQPEAVAAPEAPASAAPAPTAGRVAPETVLQAAEILLQARELATAKAEAPAANSEAADINGAQQAIAAIAALIITEAESLALGNLNEACDIELLLDAVRALKWFKYNEEMEEAAMQLSDQTASTNPTAADPTLEPADTTKAAETTPAAPQTPDAAQAPDILTKADVTDLVKSAVAEATSASEGRITALEADLAKAHGELDAIKAQPLPGGPVLTRTAVQHADARRADADQLRAQAAAYKAKADAVSDRTLRDGYLEKASELLTKAEA